MELHASGEDYLEAVLIWGQRMGRGRAVDVARYLGFAKTSFSHGLRLLLQGGFLTRDGDGYLYFTEAGRETAEKIYARHRFFTQWLIGAGVAPDVAEQDACRMEYAISEESFRKLMQALADPEHGEINAHSSS
ncbi:metal-dependent transcriptional regulator [Pseudoflavonifractor sp. 60]|uniref:metal-dependent transcriptional regulator n=1 Tax=Pseudoflavonifractor sp. 60 TaxID=2304576 RepID=UPI00136A6E8F|nr:metal-dependent transcriptional regulator [Pseudoflavonifractor sp. 60]NBI65895.1 metal-dependent transcriptional regulator [Pseudoflavonifractor sp. 60]